MEFVCKILCISNGYMSKETVPFYWLDTNTAQSKTYFGVRKGTNLDSKIDSYSCVAIILDLALQSAHASSYLLINHII